MSPDDTIVLSDVIASGSFHTALVNIQNSSVVTVSDTLASFSPVGPWFWRDAQTLETLAISPTQDLANPQVLVWLNIERATGLVNTRPMTATLPGELISVAPNLSRALVLYTPQQRQAPNTISTSLDWVAPKRHAPDEWEPSDIRDQRGVLEVTTEAATLATVDLQTGALTELTQFPAGSDLINASWSPAGNRLALTSTAVRDRKDRFDQRDGALLSSLVYREAVGELPLAENPFFQNNQIQMFDLDTNTTKTRRAGDEDGARFSFGYWSTDGQTLLVQTSLPSKIAGRQHPVYNRSTYSDIRFYDLNLNEVDRVVLPDADFLEAVFVTPDDVLLGVVDHMDIRFYAYNRVSRQLRAVDEQPGTTLTFAVAPGSRQIVFRKSSFTTPPELYRINWDGSNRTQLTRINAVVAEASRLRMDPVSFQVASGQTREGWLVQPADAAFPPSDAPMVIWQEGGPTATMNNFWGATTERPYGLLPNFGIAVLVVPLPGRQGFGPTFLNALVNDRNFGQIDIDEQAEITRQLIDRGWTRPGKIGITGCSYGGYFALQSAVRHPDLYSAINPQCAVVDLKVEWARGYATWMPYMQGPRTPYDDPEEYERDSPLYNTDRIKAPVLTFHGTNDFFPVALNENLHQRLVSRGVPARMVKFVGAGHGLFDRSFRIYAAQEQIQWFRTYLIEQANAPSAPNRPSVFLPFVRNR